MVIWLVAGGGTFLLLLLYLQSKQTENSKKTAAAILEQAESKAKMALDTAKLEAKELLLKAEQASYQKSVETKEACVKMGASLQQQEELLSKEKHSLQQKLQEVQKKEKALLERDKELSELEKAYNAKLNLTLDEAKDQIIQAAQKQTEKHCMLHLLHKQQECEARAEEHARKVLIQSIGRLPQKALSDATLCEVLLPNEEIKAKIIGREGKNIKAFQQLTGVTVVIDDTPKSLVLSSFDPQRREIAKTALLELIQDGRITAERIQEEVLAATKQQDIRLLKYGQEAMQSCGLSDLHPTLLVHLGRLKLRTSFGQNLLEHSCEVAQIMGLIAAELKLNIAKATRMGLLHDIGKAYVLDTPLSHAIAGYRLCLECLETEEVANGVGCHHDEMPAGSLEAMLVKCADYLSGARRGVRAENSEQFAQRARDFEAQALSFSGVKSAFAMSAGRELQVFVRPEVVSDVEALVLAKNIAEKIQGISPNVKVQVSVIRETKSIHYT